MTSRVARSVEVFRAAFERASAPTVGFEEEVMVLDPHTYDLAGLGREIVHRLGDGQRFKLELPASQLEITSNPALSAQELGRQLLEARRTLADRAADVARFGCAGVHPFAAERGAMNTAPPYDWTLRRYGLVARKQLVCALQVHVAVPGAERVLPVYNAARSHLPELLAVTANAPVYRGEDTGLATVRPTIAEQLPRQGVPPVLEGWEHYGAALAWGARSGAFPRRGAWWWELRPHGTHGTLEVRVPDAQTTVGEATAVFALVQSLVVWLGDRHDADDLPPPAETWRIEENRWSAIRYGTRGRMADLETGRSMPTEQRLHSLLDALEATAERLASREQLSRVRTMIDQPGWLRQLEVLRQGGPRAVAEHLSRAFTCGEGQTAEP